MEKAPMEGDKCEACLKKLTEEDSEMELPGEDASPTELTKFCAHEKLAGMERRESVSCCEWSENSCMATKGPCKMVKDDEGEGETDKCAMNKKKDACRDNGCLWKKKVCSPKKKKPTKCKKLKTAVDCLAKMDCQVQTKGKQKVFKKCVNK